MDRGKRGGPLLKIKIKRMGALNQGDVSWRIDGEILRALAVDQKPGLRDAVGDHQKFVGARSGDVQFAMPMDEKRRSGPRQIPEVEVDQRIPADQERLFGRILRMGVNPQKTPEDLGFTPLEAR